MLFGEWVRRVDRWGVWVLLVLVLLFVLTGFGMTRHLMDPLLANYVHTRLLPVPLFVLFLVHVLRPVRNLFKGWKIFAREAYLDLYVWGLAAILLTAFLWIYFH